MSEPFDETLIARIGDLLSRDREDGGLSPGDRAELRRMLPESAPLPPAMWRLLAGLAVPHDQAVERAVALLIQLMAETGAGPTPIGAALAATGYAEDRFVRLLRARGLDAVAHHARQAAHWCAAHGVRPGYSGTYRDQGFAWFVLAAARDAPEAERRGHALARDYFNPSQADAAPSATPVTEPTP